MSKQQIYLAENIKFLRKRAGLNQGALGDKLGITHAQVGAYERGESDPPTSKLLKLCEIFVVDLGNLVYSDLSAPAIFDESKLNNVHPRATKVVGLMRIREYYATQALLGLLSNSVRVLRPPGDAAKAAVEYADALIEELEKTND